MNVIRTIAALSSMATGNEIIFNWSVGSGTSSDPNIIDAMDVVKEQVVISTADYDKPLSIG